MSRSVDAFVVMGISGVGRRCFLRWSKPSEDATDIESRQGKVISGEISDTSYHKRLHFSEHGGGGLVVGFYSCRRWC
jgi:hypothetical protein